MHQIDDKNSNLETNETMEEDLKDDNSEQNASAEQEGNINEEVKEEEDVKLPNIKREIVTETDEPEESPSGAAGRLAANFNNELMNKLKNDLPPDLKEDMLSLLKEGNMPSDLQADMLSNLKQDIKVFSYSQFSSFTPFTFTFFFMHIAQIRQQVKKNLAMPSMYCYILLIMCQYNRYELQKNA